MFHITMRRRRFLLMILFCEVALYTLIYQPDFLTVYFPAKAVPPAVPKPLPEEGITLLEKFSFEKPEDLALWEEKSFNGKTVYTLAVENGRPYLAADSRKACSGLYRSVQVEPTEDLFVEWTWRARTFPSKAVPPRFDQRGQDDFAARIYLVFPGTNFFKSNVIEYLWDEHAQKDFMATSPYSDRIKMIVAASGKAAGDGWLTHRRNVVEDYVRLFGKPPTRPLGIVAVMSDSDNTGTAAAADFGTLRLFRKAD
jgi:hypothetical protein